MTAGVRLLSEGVDIFQCSCPRFDGAGSKGAINGFKLIPVDLGAFGSKVFCSYVHYKRDP